MATIIDISPPLSEQTAVWPGDVSLSRRVQMRMEKGDSVDLSCLATTVHIGAHADAPSHYHRDGVAIDQVALEPYIGPCLVIDCSGAKAITPRHLDAVDLQAIKRFLFRTRSQPNDVTKFDESFAYFETETLELLGKQGAVLVGIDTPSVDPFHSKGMLAHNVLYKYNMRNLEGLELSHVEPGQYELIALPLRLVGFDGSPLRAVLRKC